MNILSCNVLSFKITAPSLAPRSFACLCTLTAMSVCSKRRKKAFQNMFSVEFTITNKKRFGTWANAFQMELKFSRRVNTLHRFHGLMALEVMQSGTHTRSINMGEILKLNR
jgi:hypothetical protein